MPVTARPGVVLGVPTSPALLPRTWRDRRRARSDERTARRDAAFRARMDDARVVLARAADVVAAGWIQNAWYQVSDDAGAVRTVTARNLELLEQGPVVAACLVGAVVHAAGGRYAARDQVTGDSLDLAWHAGFADDRRFGVGFSPPMNVRSWRVLDLTRWNDWPGRRIDDVLGL